MTLADRKSINLYQDPTALQFIHCFTITIPLSVSKFYRDSISPLWKRGKALVIHTTSLSLAEDLGLLGTKGVFVVEEVETFSLRNARHAAPIR